MCLTTKRRWPKIAWKPITTYKVVYSPNNYPSLLTIFQDFPIQIGNTYEETLGNIFRGRRRLHFNKYEIHEGIHSNTKLYQSRVIANYFREPNPIIVKCVIPKFSFYWIGDDNDIVSNKLKYVKIL